MSKHQTFNLQRNRIVIVCVKRFCKATRMEFQCQICFCCLGPFYAYVEKMVG